MANHFGTGANVRTFHKPQPGQKQLGTAPSQDNHKIGAARVRLKLAALSYVASRHGIDSNESLAMSAIGMLARSAVWYVGALENKDRSGMSMPRPDGHSAFSHALDQLKLAALAYEQTRHGGDGGGGFCRDGLALLCQGSINLVEAIDNVSKSDLVDSTLKLDDGM